MRKDLFLALFLLVAVCAGGAQAYQLAYKDPAGATRWYRSEMTIKGSMNVQPMNTTIPINGAVKFLMMEKVLSVNDDGTSTITMALSDGSITMTMPDAEQPMTMPFPEMVMTYQRTPSGKTTGMQLEGQPGGAFAMPGMEQQMKLVTGMQGLEFPTGDLKVGDSWDTKQDFEFMPGQKAQMTITNTFKGPQVVDGATYLLLNTEMTLEIPSFKMTIPAGEQTITMEQSLSMACKIATLFDEQAGEINRALMNAGFDMKVTAPMPDGQTMVTTGTMTMSGGMKKIPAPTGT